MSGIYKKCLVLAACYLLINQVQAQVTPSLSPRPIKPMLSQPARPGERLMPQQRDYSWYVNQLQKRGGVQAATTMVRKPMAIANPTQMPANRSFDWYRQHLLKRYPHLSQPGAARATATSQTSQTSHAVMPAQRSYEWYQQQLDASRQRTHLTPIPGNRN